MIHPFRRGWNLRKIGNLFVVSLAIADLFVACVVMTFALVNDLLGYWPFGERFCSTWIAFDVMCSTASIVNLCAISLDRYIHIKKKQQCALELSVVYAVVSSCISFFLPCCVMLAIYSRLYLYAKRHVESIKALVRPVTLGALEGDTSRPKKVAAPCHVSESKAATTVGIIVGTFLTCWVPFFCVNIAAAFCQGCIKDEVFKTLTWFGYTNSSFNPIIYSIFNQEFRDAFKRILTSRCRPCPSCCSQTCCCGDSSGFPPYSPYSCCSCCPLEKSRPRTSARSSVPLCVEVPRHHHQNGSSSTALTEYTVLDALATPRLSHDRSRASSGERCLILEQISAI
ncbi:Dopamine receptor 1-like 1 [Homarus americanus]|uniref:Dopamine receptor 1-like 1 n=1 Tax=Homarus americanus TaxID=6706 RepID=A0A8J5JLU2_HOMAM|nr:Dopamine receptor 1-like 1 [Homarus americanus]